MKKLATLLLALCFASPVFAEDKYGGVVVFSTGGGGGSLPVPGSDGMILGSYAGAPEWEILGGGNGNCTLQRVSAGNYALNCPKFVTTTSATFTGPVCFADGACWNANGLNNGTHFAIGQNAGTDQMDITANGNLVNTFAMSNNDARTGAQVLVRLANAVNEGDISFQGMNYSAGDATHPPNALSISTTGSSIYIGTVPTTGEIDFYIANVEKGFFNSTGFHLTPPLETVSGGTGSSTGPTSGQILIGQTGGVYAPKTMSGAVTMDANGVTTVVGGGGSGLPNGSPPQLVGYSTANTGEAETISGDTTYTRAGANSYTEAVTRLHFGAANPVTLPNGAPVAGGIPYFPTTGSISSSALLAANKPIIGMGAGVAPVSGGSTGNTTTFVTAFGTLTSGDCAKWDVGGNLTDSGGTCGGTGAPLVNPTGGQNNYAPLANPSFTGGIVVSGTAAVSQVSVSGSGTWNASGLNITSALTFNGTAMGGICAGGQFVNVISATGAPTCATPTVGNFAPLTNPTGGQNNYAPLAGPSFTGAVHMATPLEVASGGTGTALAPTANQVLVAQSGSAYKPVTMSGDVQISGTGATTVNSIQGSPVGTTTSWTPSFAYTGGGGPTVTYSVQTGSYARVGNIVFWTIEIGWSAFSQGAGGTMEIVGLPFSLNTNVPSGGAASLYAGINYANPAAGGIAGMTQLGVFNEGNWFQIAANGGNVAGTLTVGSSMFSSAGSLFAQGWGSL